MEHYAKVIRLNPNIEEEVRVEINGNEFTGFAIICPYEIEEGKRYPVELGFAILDEFTIHELFDDKKGIMNIDNAGYTSKIFGILHEEYIDAGIAIQDDDGYFQDFLPLTGKYVEVEVDKINIEFL
ncbi:hypothetical protein ABRT01_16840 [Lentibacillus sp. L22]|uniref:hypothetical protein n=1 Tax=Lentibacillus TaxID=175304 RepID=UPI0022B0E9A0|nr:hypothetical protein [Lentibacillus daqui]